MTESYVKIKDRETQRCSLEWATQRSGQHWTQDTDRKQTKEETQHRKLKI